MKKILETIGYPEEAYETLNAALDALAASDKRDELLAVMDTGRLEYARFDELAKELSLPNYTVYMAMLVLYIDRSREIFKEKGIAEDIWYATLRDITIWTKSCHANYGVWGITEFSWVLTLMKGNILRLGRLQFHIIKFPQDYTLNGREIKKGDEIINIHIPEDGPLTRELRLDAYRRAAEFFGMDLFTCHSWLLWPEGLKFLPPHSNIRDFLCDFTIVESNSNHGPNLWRVFGRRDSYDPATLPRNSSLQRAYADHLAAGGKMGDGLGVFLLSDIEKKFAEGR